MPDTWRRGAVASLTPACGGRKEVLQMGWSVKAISSKYRILESRRTYLSHRCHEVWLVLAYVDEWFTGGLLVGLLSRIE
jgi:hypothetical protein